MGCVGVRGPEGAGARWGGEGGLVRGGRGAAGSGAAGGAHGAPAMGRTRPCVHTHSQAVHAVVCLCEPALEALALLRLDPGLARAIQARLRARQAGGIRHQAQRILWEEGSKGKDAQGGVRAVVRGQRVHLLHLLVAQRARHWRVARMEGALRAGPAEEVVAVGLDGHAQHCAAQRAPAGVALEHRGVNLCHASVWGGGRKARMTPLGVVCGTRRGAQRGGWACAGAVAAHRCCACSSACGGGLARACGVEVIFKKRK